ncbi:MAG: hypothetical protein H0X01_09845, partial [Nitrospira sp.]|nr:hypothetical protein [Nitrospira sp.]
IDAVQIELVNRIQSFGRLRIQLVGQCGEKIPHSFGWSLIHRLCKQHKAQVLRGPEERTTLL